MLFLFSLPSTALTLDIMVEESEAAPMEDGAIPMPPLPVERPTASLDLQRGGLPLSLLRFPGHRRHPFCWQPYGLHDVARYILLLDCILDISPPEPIRWIERP